MEKDIWNRLLDRLLIFFLFKERSIEGKTVRFSWKCFPCSHTVRQTRMSYPRAISFRLDKLSIIERIFLQRNTSGEYINSEIHHFREKNTLWESIGWEIDRKTARFDLVLLWTSAMSGSTDFLEGVINERYIRFLKNKNHLLIYVSLKTKAIS